MTLITKKIPDFMAIQKGIRELLVARIFLMSSQQTLDRLFRDIDDLDLEKICANNRYYGLLINYLNDYYPISNQIWVNRNLSALQRIEALTQDKALFVQALTAIRSYVLFTYAHKVRRLLYREFKVKKMHRATCGL